MRGKGTKKKTKEKKEVPIIAKHILICQKRNGVAGGKERSIRDVRSGGVAWKCHGQRHSFSWQIERYRGPREGKRLKREKNTKKKKEKIIDPRRVNCQR